MDRKARISYADVHNAIFTRIVQGRYRPSRRIGVAELASQLSVSTTPVREALRQLTGRDIVVERPREGFYLAPLSASTIANLYQAHARVIETLLGQAIGSAPSKRKTASLWKLFDDCAVRNTDEAAVAIQRYLRDRLAVLRRAEAIVCHNPVASATAFSSAWANADVETARMVSRDFHARCADQATRLAALFDPAT